MENLFAITSSRTLYHRVSALLLYQSVFDNAIGKSFTHLLNTLHHKDNEQSYNSTACLQAYGEFFQLLANSQQSWQDFLIQQILNSENPFSKQAQYRSVQDLPPSLIQAVKHDLMILQNIYDCSLTQIIQWVEIASQTLANVVAWEIPNQGDNFLAASSDWTNHLDDLVNYYQHHGIGLFGSYQAFIWQQGQLQGVNNPDRLTLSTLVGYEEPKAKLIQVSKSELHNLPQILELLRPVPQKFILFVDDLSFEEDDDTFKSLKVILEGSITAKAPNVVVYATSNRRHLVREFFSDRPRPLDSDEVQAWDTVQEKLSFGDRFGLTLTFEPANQDTYLTIVHHLAQQIGITLEKEDLDFRAKQWATRHNGRSGRTARQFIDYLQGELALRHPNL
jgi:predicted AAA+ superfamily ATPase